GPHLAAKKLNAATRTQPLANPFRVPAPHSLSHKEELRAAGQAGAKAPISRLEVLIPIKPEHRDPLPVSFMPHQRGSHAVIGVWLHLNSLPAFHRCEASWNTKAGFPRNIVNDFGQESAGQAGAMAPQLQHEGVARIQ